MAALIEFVIFGGLAYWLFSDRARAVIDLISTKLQELYNEWGAQRKLPQKKEKSASDVQARFSNKIEQRKPRLTGFDCSMCSPFKRGSLVSVVHNTSAVNILNVENLKSHSKGLLSTLLPQLCQAFSFKKYHFTYIYESVLNDERIQEVYETAARQALEDPEIMTDPSVSTELLRKQKQRADKILTTLRSTFSDKILRLSSFVMSKVWMKLFSSVVVNPAQIDMLLKAEACNVPLIFLPLHRSHLDYIVITFILANNNIKSPLVAAGENLRIPFFGSLLRGLGAFFIKRRMDPVNGKRDILYRAVLHTYMMHCLRVGYNFEFFIEGGRTRTGKPCMPKGGLLSVFLDAYMDGTIDDALLVPVSINYERLVDGNFIKEQMGKPKQMETFGSAISAIWKVLTSHYGSMRIDFNQPFSLKELVNSFEKKSLPSPQQQSNKKVLHTVPSTASLYGTDVVVEEHRQLVDSIARHVIYDCSCSTAAMSTNAVSFLLCTTYREGVDLSNLAQALDRLRDELFACNKSLGFSGESVDVIKHAVKILGPGLVTCERNNESGTEIVTPVTKLPNIIELSYYSNSLVPHYVLEAVVVRSIRSLLRRSEGCQVSHTALLETSLQLCEILQYEFIFTKFCQTLDDAIFNTIDTVIDKEIISRRQITLPNEETCQGNANTDNVKDTEHQIEIQYMENCDHPLLPFYNAILQPFLDVYSVSSLQMQSLLSRHVSERDYLEEILQVIKTQLDKGQLQYGESMSIDTVRNCLKLLEKWEVLDCYSINRVKMCSLGERYDDELSLRNIVSRIEEFQ